MSDKPISDLRRRMIADMMVRSFGEKTQHDYVRHIETFAKFRSRSPGTATGDDIRRFQLAHVEQPPKINTQGFGIALLLHPARSAVPTSPISWLAPARPWSQAQGHV
jgi:hypothetical protein